MKVTVDRKEGDFYVMVSETGEKFNLPISPFPNLKDGDVLDLSDTDIKSATEKAQEQIKNLKTGLNKVEL